MRNALVLLALLAIPLRAQQIHTQIHTDDKITVERILVDARVTDYQGDPVLGLDTSDFNVRIDGKVARVESADWIPESAGARAIAGLDKPQQAEVNTSLDEPPPQGRLLIFFFQTDFARASQRISGQMHILGFADDLIETLDEDDRVAVLSFDSHLKFRLDFTNDKTAIRDAIRNSLLIDEPPRPPMVPLPSLASHLKPAEMKRASTSEEAFVLVANALRPIAGPKSMILFGWGLGTLINGRVVMGVDYAIAKRALEAARVTVFSLDTTMADSHSLEAGLGIAAADTGGFYAKTYTFPQIAIGRLEKTLAGHYELEVRKPETKVVGVHSIEVTTSRKATHVMARSTYIDKMDAENP